MDKTEQAAMSLAALGREVAEGAKAKGRDIAELTDDSLVLTEEQLEAGRKLVGSAIETE